MQSGAPATSIMIPLAPNGTGKAALTGSGFTAGWVRVSTSPPAGLISLETIQLIKDGNVVADSSVLPANPSTNFQFPVVERNDVDLSLR